MILPRIAFLVAFLLAAPAQADHKFLVFKAAIEVVCAEGMSIDHDIRTQNFAAPIKRGHFNDGSVMQLYADKERDVWAITILNPTDGKECLVLSGKNLQSVLWVLDKGKPI